MELIDSSNQINDATKQQVLRNNSRGIRVVGNRIYDPANGKSCHQCRQKTRDFAASCKNPKKGKPCVIKFCYKCLLNRYGEKAEEVELLDNWTCPKCRGHCNCSFCMKKRGQQPTGSLVHTAKASGFKSVSDMLSVNVPDGLPTKETTIEEEQKRADNLSSGKGLKGKAVSPTKAIAPEKEVGVDLSGELAKENSSDGNNDVKFDPIKVQKTSKKAKKTKREELKEISNGNNVDDACQHKKSKKPKHCNGVSDKEAKVDKKHGQKNGSCEASAAKDSCCDPKTLAKKGVSSNSIPCEVKQVHQEKLNGNVAIGDGYNGGVKSKMGIAQSEICIVHLDAEKIDDVPLPPGTLITHILDIELSPKDVANALQFLEFCRVFGKAVDVKKGEAEAILRELIRKQNLRRRQNTLVVQFQIRLLTLILTDSGTESTSLTANNGKISWWKALEDLITASGLVLKEFPMDWLNEGLSGYYNLDLSKKLTLLNFLCDEALGTEKLRSYIDDQNERFVEEMKEAKSKITAAKEKKRSLKQKLRDEIAKAFISNEASLSIAEHNALLSKIKSDAAKAHTEMLEAEGTVPKRKQNSDAMRIEPEFLDSSGQTFWKLKCYNGEYAVMLQDIKIQDGDAATIDERWFLYGPEQKNEIDKFISSRDRRSKTRKVPFPSESREANVSAVISF